MIKDQSETKNLAAANPDKVKELAAIWEREAKRTYAWPWPWK